MTKFIVDYDSKTNTPESVKDFERLANRGNPGLYRLDYMWVLKFAVKMLGEVALTRDRDDVAMVIQELYSNLHLLVDYPDMAEPMAEDIVREVNRLATFLPDDLVLSDDRPRRCEIIDHRHGALLIEIL